MNYKVFMFSHLENLDRSLDFTPKKSPEIDLINEIRFNEVKNYNSHDAVDIAKFTATFDENHISQSNGHKSNIENDEVNNKIAKVKDLVTCNRGSEDKIDIFEPNVYKTNYEMLLKTSLMKRSGSNDDIYAEVDNILKDLNMNIDEQGSLLLNTLYNSRYLSSNRLLGDIIDTINNNNNNEPQSFSAVMTQNEENINEIDLSTLDNLLSEPENRVYFTEEEKKSQDMLLHGQDSIYYHGDKNDENSHQKAKLIQNMDSVRKSKNCFIF